MIQRVGKLDTRARTARRRPQRGRWVVLASAALALAVAGAPLLAADGSRQDVAGQGPAQDPRRDPVAPCPDADTDLWGVTVPGCDATGLLGVGDCDDGNAAINPGAAEVCGDGIDNDCDGDIDFGLYDDDFGPPIPGFEATGSCSLPDPPGCMFINDLPPPGGCCLTASHKECNGSNTAVVCVSNSTDGTIRMQIPEGPIGDPTCFDGIDNDCDFYTDHADSTCFDASEPCNGFDDDNDGMVDETFPLKGTPCTVGTGACERTGLYICDGAGGLKCSKSAGGMVAENTPGVGVCVDGEDNDCDGLIDLQDDDCHGPEKCDGKDNDGNGMTDETFPVNDPCVVGTGQCERAGTEVCKADGSGTVCSAMPDATAAGVEAPGDASCNDGMDNDCDGLIDGADPGCFSANLSITCALIPTTDDEVIPPDDDPLPPPALPAFGGAPSTAAAPGRRSASPAARAGGRVRSPRAAAGAPWSFGAATGPGADENECVGLYRVEFDVFGDGTDTDVIAEVLVFDTAGGLLAVLPVENGDLVDLESELDSEEWAWVAGDADHAHRIVAPAPVLRVRARDPLNEAEAYCAPIPYLDIIRPDNTTVAGTDADAKVELLAAIPLVDPATLSVEVDGVEILSLLGIDPSTSFPGTHPGGPININGTPVNVSGIAVDVAPSVDLQSTNTLRLTLEGLECGGHSLVVDGERIAGVPPEVDSEACAPLDDPDPFVDDCFCADLHDCGATSVFQIQIDSPTEGQITNVVPTPVTGDVCHGVEILRASVNGKSLDTSLQTFTPGGGECAAGTYELAIDTALPQTNLHAEAAGMNTSLGTFDPGVNRLIASATDVEAHRAFKTFVFAVGEPSDLIQTTVAHPRLAAPGQAPAGGNLADDRRSTVEPEGLDWDYDIVAGPDALTVQGTAIVDAFVFGIEGEALDAYLAATCADLSACITDELNEAICNLHETQPVSSPCCDPTATITTIGCGTANAPGFLGEFTCNVTAMDGPGPNGTEGKIVVELQIPRINFKVRVQGGCHGGFLWGCNTDVDMDLDVTLPHPGDPGCAPGAPNVCPDLTMQDEDCCIPTQPLIDIALEIEERDFPTADFPGSTPASCACEEGDTDCENQTTCCDPNQPGCITGKISPSAVIRGEITRGGISAGGWNTVVLGILAFVVGGLLLGPIGALLGGAILVGAFLLLFGASDLSGFTFTPDVLDGINLEGITQAVGKVDLSEAPYQAMDILVDTELSSVKVNAAGLTAAIDLGLQIVTEDPNVEPSLGFLSTPAPAPMPPIPGGNTFVVFSDDLLNGIFAAATRQGLASTEGCSGTLAQGACCDGGPDFDMVDDLFPQFPTDCADNTLLCCDDPAFLTGNEFTDAAIIGTCLGIRAGDMPEAQASALCESFEGGPLFNDLVEIIGQATCHGVRGANCGQIPIPLLSIGTERYLCNLVPPLHIKASDGLLLCARTGIEPRFLISDDTSTPAVESRLHLNDMLVSLVIDRAGDGYNGDLLPTIASCLDDGTDSDCSLLGICLDLTFMAEMQLVAGANGPEVAFDLGDPIVQDRPEGEVCEGGINLTYNYDPETTQGASESDPIEEDLAANAGSAVPIQAPENIDLGRFVQFQSPELFALKTGTEAGRCTTDLDLMCTTDADCGGAECILFQDYLGVRGSIVADVPPTPQCPP